MVQLTDIVRISCGFSNVWLIKNGSHSLLIDTGRKGYSRKILRVIQQNNLKLSDVKYILITHTHFDHCANAFELKKKLHADLFVHEFESRNIQIGYKSLAKGRGLFSCIMYKLSDIVPKSFFSYSGVMYDQLVRDADELRFGMLNVKIIHTPGHSKGSVSFLVDDRFLFVGDLMFNLFSESKLPPFVNDMNVLQESWRRLDLNAIELIFPGHGKAFQFNKK